MGGLPIRKGDKFGRLTAIEQTYKTSKSGRKRSHWICWCECGGLNTVDGGNLRNGNTRWCADCASEWKSKHRSTHGQTRKKAPTKSYQTWAGIKSRVRNPNDARFSDYGGRGIDMSPRWACSFEAFHADMGDPPSSRHQIDRKDNDKGYWPDNCRWADLIEQANNKRSCIVVAYRGEVRTLPDWCRHLGLKYETIYRRYKRDNSNLDAVFSPKKLPKGPNSKERF